MGQQYGNGLLRVFQGIAGLFILAVLIGVVGIGASYTTAVPVAQGDVSMQNDVSYNDTSTPESKTKHCLEYCATATPSPEGNQSKSDKFSTESGESTGANPYDSTTNPSHNGDSCRETVDSSQGPSCLHDVIYMIQPGDTLSSISQKFSISVDALVKYNNIHHADWIYANSSIRIPYTELKK